VLYSTFRQSPVVLLLLSASLSASGAQIPRLTLEDLLNRSQYIVHGRVSRTWAEWDRSHKYIWTHHEVEVVDVLRGVVAGQVTVSEPGGSLEGVHQSFSGALAYRPGEEVVLFLYRTPVGFLRVAGGCQGKFTVAPDGKTHANLNGLQLLEVDGSRPGASLATLETLDIREFKRRIRQAVRARLGPPRE